MSFVILRKPGWCKETCETIAWKMNELDSSINAVSKNERQTLPDNRETLVRWGAMGDNTRVMADPVLINSPGSIAASSKKGNFRMKMQLNSISTPNTNMIDNGMISISEHAVRNFVYPVIVRPNHHFGGSGFYFCNNIQEVNEALLEIEGWRYVSEFIRKDYEFRFYVFEGRIVAVAEKHSANGSRASWNLERGYDDAWTILPRSKWVRRGALQAIEAMDVACLDFGAVDIIVKRDINAHRRMQPYVLEINTAPRILSDYVTTCIAKAFVFSAENECEPERPELNAGWRDYIHPGVMGVAI